MDIKVIPLVASLAIITQSAVLKNGIEIPQYATTCRRSQADIDDCLKNSLQTVIQKISKEGIPQINFPAMDPWKVEEMRVESSGYPIKMIFTLTKNVKYGFSKLQILGVRSNFGNPRNISLDVDFFNKEEYGSGSYLTEGYVADIPIFGKGVYSGSMKNLSATLRVRGHLVNRDGEDYLKIDRMLMRPRISDLKVQMRNENNKYPELTNLLVSVVNQFWKPMYEGALPYFERLTDEILTTRCNMATLKIPYNQLIPE